MDVIKGIRLIRENSFQTTREVLVEAEQTIEDLRSLAQEILDLAFQIYVMLPVLDAQDDLTKGAIGEQLAELQKRLEEHTE